MYLCAVGDTHGLLDRMYEEVAAFERHLGLRFHWVLHVGDLGVWPDPERIDKATRKHGGAGDFPRWWAERRAAPRPTVFIAGNHEDFEWLEGKEGTEVLPGLTYLGHGSRYRLRTEQGEALWVGGLGGAYGPRAYGQPARALRGRARRSYSREEVERLGRGGRLDVLLLHDAPAGARFQEGRRQWRSEAEGLSELLRRTRPRACFFGHHHVRLDHEVHGIRCIGLNLVPRPGSLLAVELSAGRGPCRLLGEWPPPGPTS